MKSGLKHPDAYKIFKKVFKATYDRTTKKGKKIVGSRKEGERVMAKKLREHAILFAFLSDHRDDKRSYNDFEQEYRDFCTVWSHDMGDFVDRKLHMGEWYKKTTHELMKKNSSLRKIKPKRFKKLRAAISKLK